MRKSAKGHAGPSRNIVSIDVDALMVLLKAGHPVPTVTWISKSRRVKRRKR
jgi:hypothetical protein